MAPRTVLVTGANGFIGRAVVAAFAARGIGVRRAVRKATDGNEIAIGPIGPDTDWRRALDGVDAVVHLAAKVSGGGDFRAINVEGTAALARACVAAGVRRFVFASSLSVYGRHASAARIDAATPLRPVSPYGISKLEAERVLSETGLEVVTLRPPVVFGPAGHGSVERLFRLLVSGAPLPFGCVTNARSLLYVGNCADAILACTMHPDARGRTYLVRDGEDVSIRDLALLLGSIPGVKRPRLMNTPLWTLRIGATLVGRRVDYERIAGGLVVDDGPLRTELGWQPPFSLREGLTRTVASLD